jgi:hypothetical protein
MLIKLFITLPPPPPPPRRQQVWKVSPEIFFDNAGTFRKMSFRPPNFFLLQTLSSMLSLEGPTVVCKSGDIISCDQIGKYHFQTQLSYQMEHHQ